MAELHLVLLIHAHQPIGNFDEVLERTYERSYLPFLGHLARHPSVRIGLHYSGALLEWIERSHPEFFELLRELVAGGQAELIGGGFYEPILIAIPPRDQAEQLRRMSDYLERHFGQRPSGAWLAERVWEPQLPGALADAGIAYTLVDDTHFLGAGFEPHELHGYYLAEDCGRTVKVIAGLKALRYLIPFRNVEETIGFLRTVAREHPGGMAAMGDDCEKFGAWPSTYDHCYRDGWLERFFSALEASSDWLAVTPPGEYLTAHPPLGRADLPTASYTEMMEWALPTSVRQRFHNLEQEFASRPDGQQFLRGGFWRCFLRKYAEANLLHKKMLHVSERIRESSRRRRADANREKLAHAWTHVLRAQCNDAYWHGIFGGLYASHLRTEVWRELVRAETLVDTVKRRGKKYLEITRTDFDADGAEEIYVTSPKFGALVKPADGGTLAALDFRAAGATLINSVQRRPEAYHARLAEAAAHVTHGAASIHERMLVKEPGLERRLRHDRWGRHAFRLLVFPSGKTYEDYEALRLEESACFAGAAYQVRAAEAGEIKLALEAPQAAPGADQGFLPALGAAKTLSFSHSGGGFDVSCELELDCAGAEPLRLQVGLEVVMNFLAPDKPDRYIETAVGRQPLGWGGAVPASQLRVVDEWQNVAATLHALRAEQFWIAPIETVSESEGGFERVYQGSQILALWPVEITPGARWTAQAILRVRLAR